MVIFIHFLEHMQGSNDMNKPESLFIWQNDIDEYI